MAEAGSRKATATARYSTRFATLFDNGIKWRAIPADFPAWTAVYAFFRRWRRQGLVVYRSLLNP
nr:transposase [Streptomyces sp. NBC_01001]